MPTIISYVLLDRKLDKTTKHKLLVREIKDYLSRRVLSKLSNECIADYLFKRSSEFMKKYDISLEEYYKAVNIILDYDMIPFNCKIIKSLLIHQLNQQSKNIIDILEGRR